MTGEQLRTAVGVLDVYGSCGRSGVDPADIDDIIFAESHYRSGDLPAMDMSIKDGTSPTISRGIWR